MVEKLSLERFNEIKKQIDKLINDNTKYYLEHVNKWDFDSKKFTKHYIEEQLKLQNEVLKYDLSDIPYEAWEGFKFYSDTNNIFDLSNTNANIDFSFFRYDDNCIFKGCNIRNLDQISNSINKKNFDEEVIENNKNLFLSENFSNSFQENYYSSILTMDDLILLDEKQLEELKEKNYLNRMIDDEANVIKAFGLDKTIKMYKISPEYYDDIVRIVSNGYLFGYDFIGNNNQEYGYEYLINQIKEADATDIRKLCFEFSRQLIINDSSVFSIDDFPESFVNENKELFLVDKDIPESVKNRYFKRELTIKDLIDYEDAFDDIIIDNFMGYDNYVPKFVRTYFGLGKFQNLVKEHKDIFNHISNESDFYQFNDSLLPGRDLEKSFKDAVKNYYRFYYPLEYDNENNIILPEWMDSMNFKVVDKYYSLNDLLKYDDSVFVIDNRQRRVLDILNIENIKRLEKETGFFSHKENEWSRDLEMFDMFSSFFTMFGPSALEKKGIYFENGGLSYEEFLTQFAVCLDNMRSTNIFTDFPNYSWMSGKFREEHPSIFMDDNAPSELKDAFYSNQITPDLLFGNTEYIKYLSDKKLSNTLRLGTKLVLPNVDINNNYMYPATTSFMDEYIKYYGNEKLLKLVSKYGNLLSLITINCLEDEFKNEELLEKNIRDTIYNTILKTNHNYFYLSSVDDFTREHQDIFINGEDLISIPLEDRTDIIKKYYNRKLSYEDIRKYPILVDILKNKNLKIAFGNENKLESSWMSSSYIEQSDIDLLETYGNEDFLKLCSLYGRYMNNIAGKLNNRIILLRDTNYTDVGLSNRVPFNKLTKIIEDIIIEDCKLGKIDYKDSDAPLFLKEKCPELFLNDDAPLYLKECFYRIDKKKLDFNLLQSHKEWLPYLKDKSIKTALLRDSELRKEYEDYFKLFGNEDAIRLGIARSETVTRMIKNHKIELMKSWYDITGKKFIPDFVVMQNFDISEASKFLVSGSNWSSLMRIKNFSRYEESREAMLKLAYSFGAFDNDQRGYKKLIELLTGIPRKIDSDKDYIIDRIDSHINEATNRINFYKYKSVLDENNIASYESTLTTDKEKQAAYEKMIKYVKDNTKLYNPFNVEELINNMNLENLNIDYSKNIFSQIYKKGEDGNYYLTINPQSYPKTTEIIRGILENLGDLNIVTPNLAHHYFGGFKLQYDPSFRDFFLSNFDEIMREPKYLSQISNIQRRFNELKTVYSNVNLTLDLAVSYLNDNKYENVEVGNENVTKAAAIQNYSQSDFEIIQKIFNYARKRTFSSIPRVESKEALKLETGTYNYEILRLDNPRAMSIGFESDCCQRLGENAELCMEHSMVDNNGRVFIITNELGEVVAQSWVWRNKDVICFDNIEVPDQKMWDNGIPKGQEDSGIRNKFTDEILSIYKKAAHEMMEEDKRVYKELLDDGKITKEQYEGLRLGKVTIGLGFSNIKGSFETLKLDKSNLAKPLPFDEPIILNKNLYTNDSSTQYILEERKDRTVYDYDTLPLYNDSFTEFDDSNFKEKDLIRLEKLEVLTKNKTNYLDTSLRHNADKEKIVTELSRNYNLNPLTTRIITNPNFAIIYDTNDKEVRIGDLLFTTEINNNEQHINLEKEVIMQLHLALKQIHGNREFNVLALNSKQLNMFKKAFYLEEDMIDEERGIVHGKQY